MSDKKRADAAGRWDYLRVILPGAERVPDAFLDGFMTVAEGLTPAESEIPDTTKLFIMAALCRAYNEGDAPGQITLGHMLRLIDECFEELKPFLPGADR